MTSPSPNLIVLERTTDSPRPLPAGVPVDLANAVSMKAVRGLALRGWIAGIVIATLMMIPFPPTAQLGGGAGWIAGAGIQLLSFAGFLAFRRGRHRVGTRELLLVTWLLPVDLAIMQWLGGGWDAPYHELLLPALILGSAWLEPRRFAAFAAIVAVAALLPALYAPAAGGLMPKLVELAVWLFVSASLALLMDRVRGQARLARSDQLTGLRNRRALDELFATRRAVPLVLGIGDLNGFKQINDGHGHLAGDRCLRDVAAVLAEQERHGHQVFRWGGDEFAILLLDPPAGAMEATFVEIEREVAARVADPSGAPVGITFGWVTGSLADDPQWLTDTADAQLLQRKRARGRVRA